MKKLLLTLLVPALSVSAVAQDAFQTEALLQTKDGESIRAWILAATDTSIRYKTSALSSDFTDAKLSDFSATYLTEPAEYTAAMDLFEARKYKVAQAKFAEIKEFFKPVAALKGNHHTLAAYYEMECMRKLADYEGLATALQSFVKAPLVRDYQVRQLDLYTMWDAVRSASWDRVLQIASERDAENLPGDQRAQVAFCKGLALQNMDRGPEAIIAYNTAMTADAGASELIAQDAALNALAVYLADTEIKAAIAAWGSEGENKNSGSRLRLIEAGALARFYDKYLKVGKPLPEDLKVFLQFEAT